MRSRDDLLRDTEPFPDKFIEIKPGGANRPDLSFVSWSHYNQRLLLTYPDHSWRIIALVADGGQWAVAGELTIDGVSYAGVGTDASADNAESQAYKRAAAHAGIGLHLYGGYWLYGRLEKDAADE